MKYGFWVLICVSLLFGCATEQKVEPMEAEDLLTLDGWWPVYAFQNGIETPLASCSKEIEIFYRLDGTGSRHRYTPCDTLDPAQQDFEWELINNNHQIVIINNGVRDTNTIVKLTKDVFKVKWELDQFGGIVEVLELELRH